jgi:hypothetical protein
MVRGREGQRMESGPQKVEEFLKLKRRGALDIRLGVNWCRALSEPSRSGMRGLHGELQSLSGQSKQV